ncbi:hypothetical protein FIV36_04885 [Pseudomonas extremaustralis]|uniref:Uncharacterized protein n=1 Tax=Pseudomonas extremaustralis TaxID=359110 RepID=A0A5C5QN18_9PSED|nr:hypothetical protein FIV36_04885 [Pseudomonas extremaustralis]
MKSAHGVGPVVIGFMQVAAMVRGGAGGLQSGEGGLWAMIERNCAGLIRQLPAGGGRCLLSGLTVDSRVSSAYFRRDGSIFFRCSGETISWALDQIWVTFYRPTMNLAGTWSMSATRRTLWISMPLS